MASQEAVTPAQAGVQKTYSLAKRLDSGLRRNDGEMSLKEDLRI